MKSMATRVLIIDDDPLIRTLLVSALRKECFVAVAAEGAEGFSKALELKPDMAVIDVNMPGWDGLKTLEAFRGHVESARHQDHHADGRREQADGDGGRPRRRQRLLDQNELFQGRLLSQAESPRAGHNPPVAALE